MNSSSASAIGPFPVQGFFFEESDEIDPLNAASTRNTIQDECQVGDAMRFIKIRQAQRLNSRTHTGWSRTPTRPYLAAPDPEVIVRVTLPDGRQPHLERSWGNLCIRMWNPNLHRVNYPNRRGPF